MTDSGRKRRRRRGGVTSVQDEHNAQVAAFFRKTWDPSSTAESVADWRARDARDNPIDQGRASPKWIFTKDEEVIGYLGTVPARFVAEGQEGPAHWLKGFWVLPEYRGGPVGAAILQQAMSDLGIAASTVVAEPARKLMESVGMIDIGRLFNRLRVLEPARLLRKLDAESDAMSGLPSFVPLGVKVLQKTRTTSVAGAAVSGAGWLTSRVRGRPRRTLRCEIGWDSATSDDFDAAWEAFRPSVRATSVRDGSMVTWRYGHEEYYDVATVWDGDALRAWSIVRRPRVEESGRLKGISIAAMSDVLFPTDDLGAGLAAIEGAERLARDMNADALLCSGTHPALDTALRSRGFGSLPPNLHVLIRSDADSPDVPLSEWWLTRGDGRSDESF